MKSLISLLLAFCFMFAVNAQEPDTLNSDKAPDTTNIKLGKKEIRIVEKNGETDIKVKDRERERAEEDEDDEDDEIGEENEYEYEEHDGKKTYTWGKSSKNFKGHWDAFQIGVNSYVTDGQSTSLPDEMGYMSLNTNKSINVNINFLQQSFGIIGRNLGVVSGLGLEFTNYVFDGNNYIDKDANGNIIPVVPPFKLDKSKLSTTYLTVPVLLEFQFPGDRRSNRLFLNAGVIGGVKLGSHTKIKYKENGDKQDEKNKDDFNLNSLRYGFTAKIGIKHLSIYGTYYPVTLFEKNKGPELYPFMVGFSFDGF